MMVSNCSIFIIVETLLSFIRPITTASSTAQTCPVIKGEILQSLVVTAVLCTVDCGQLQSVNRVTQFDGPDC